MGIQLVVRLACMSANIGGVGFGLAACLAVEGRLLMRLIAVVVVDCCD